MNIIFDLDGTLADCSHRIHFINNYANKPDHRGFFAACVDDKPIHDMLDLLDMLSMQFAMHIYIVSGRSDECREATANWLKHHGVFYNELYMRKAGDHRPDYIVKKEIYLREFKDKQIQVNYVFDDRDSVVAMWRSLGLRCLQVAPGNF